MAAVNIFLIFFCKITKTPATLPFSSGMLLLLVNERCLPGEMQDTAVTCVWNVQVLEIPGLSKEKPSRVLAAPFDSDVQKDTYMTEYAGILLDSTTVRKIEETDPGSVLWVHWLMRSCSKRGFGLYVNGVPVIFQDMANNNWLASIADHSFKFTPNSTLDVRDTLILSRTRMSPSLILRSKQLIPCSASEHLSFIAISYGLIQEQEKHGIVRGV